jgi:mannose-6-phosphate isomerase-like protein (cupin superfamily)
MNEASAKVPVSLPEGNDLAAWMETRVARLATRTYDWGALKFQADYDPKYRRAQMRYIGTGGTGVKHDGNTIPSEHFTFSTMVMPAHTQGPMHIHVDAEEVFFVLKGSRIHVLVEHEGTTWDTFLGERDLFSVPPGLYREIRNEGDEEALICTMIGSSKPVRPTYPDDHPLSQLRRQVQGD